jgi:tetratricopeptide (TPR) repeat protein
MNTTQESNAPGTGHGADRHPMTAASEQAVCPNEAQLLAFYENRLRLLARRKIEKHLGGCDGCREALTLMVQLHGEAHRGADTTSAAFPASEMDDTLKDQAARVLALIERDESRYTARSRPARRFGLPIPAPAFAAIVAFLVLAAGAGIYWLYLAESPAEAGLKAVALAVKKDRRIPLAVSGLPYSPYNKPSRGGTQSDDLQFERAENKLRFAHDKSASPSARLNLARLYLERAEGDDANNAFDILKGLTGGGVKLAEVLNETGVAQYQMGHYSEAIHYFTRALAADPKMIEALFNKAVAERQVDPKLARQDYEKFIGSTSNPDWIKEAKEALDEMK